MLLFLVRAKNMPMHLCRICWQPPSQEKKPINDNPWTDFPSYLWIQSLIRNDNRLSGSKIASLIRNKNRRSGSKIAINLIICIGSCSSHCYSGSWFPPARQRTTSQNWKIEASRNLSWCNSLRFPPPSEQHLDWGWGPCKSQIPPLQHNCTVHLRVQI